PPPPSAPLFPYTTLFRSLEAVRGPRRRAEEHAAVAAGPQLVRVAGRVHQRVDIGVDAGADRRGHRPVAGAGRLHLDAPDGGRPRSEEHTSELQSLAYLVC